MTRVSEFYRLGRTQPTLDFVDVDVRGDVRVFLDPRAFRLLQSDWGEPCRDLLRTFFAEVLAAITAGDPIRARALLSKLREPNETHLGFSAGASRGHGLGRESGQSVADALSASRAARTGLLQDLEDTVLLVPRIGHDVLSDITTNVLRGPLIAYTRQQADMHDIPTAQVASGRPSVTGTTMLLVQDSCPLSLATPSWTAIGASRLSRVHRRATVVSIVAASRCASST